MRWNRARHLLLLVLTRGVSSSLRYLDLTRWSGALLAGPSGWTGKTATRGRIAAPGASCEVQGQWRPTTNCSHWVNLVLPHGCCFHPWEPSTPLSRHLRSLAADFEKCSFCMLRAVPQSVLRSRASSRRTLRATWHCPRLERGFSSVEKYRYRDLWERINGVGAWDAKAA